MNISRFAKKEFEIFLRANKFSEIHHKNMIIDLMNLKNDLYVLRIKSVKVKVEILTIKTKNSIELWHDKIKHLRYKNLMKLNHLTNEMNIVDFISKEICDNCMMKRQQRKINRIFRIRANEFLDIIHSNLRKSFSFTRKNERYYVIFKDDFINVIWTYLMKIKDMTFQKFQKFKSMMKNQSNITIKCLRADDENEFIDENFQEFLINNEIRWESRASYVSKQNEKSERMNYIFMTSVRSMLVVKKLSKFLWKEMIKTIIYIKNKSFEINDIISYERLKNDKSNLKHMRSVKARTWMHISKEKRKKLTDKSWQRIFIEYERTNQFRIYNSKIDEVHVVRNIQMNEISTYEINNNQNTDLTDVQWADEDDSLFRSFYDSDDSDEEEKLALRDRNRVKNRFSINQKTLNETSTALKVEEMKIVIEEIEHEDNLYENFEKDMQNTFVLSSNEHDFSFASEISSKRFSRTKKTSNLFSKTIIYDSKKTLLKQITNFKSHQHMIKILTMLNFDQDVIESDESQNLKKIMISFYWSEWQKTMKIENNFLLKN